MGRVVAIEEDGEDERVYCCTVPETHKVAVGIGVITGQCAEQALPPYGTCLLGSVNMVKLLEPIHDANGPALAVEHGKQVVRYGINFDLLDSAVDAAVRAFNAVIDRTTFPLEQQRQEALAKRRMGVGVTGMANALEVMGLPYASPAYLTMQDTVLERLNTQAYRTSLALAREAGPFPLWDAEQYCAGEFFRTRLPEDLQHDIKIDGLRNGLLTSIAPTGTISMAADNVSGGIEPVFQLRGRRPIFTPSGQREFDVADYAVEFYGVEGRPSDQVSGEEHIDTLCRAAHWIDNSISKTVNVAGQVGGEGPGVTFQAFKELCLRAWNGGAKSVSMFNLNGKRAGLMVPAPVAVDGAACFIDPITGERACAD
jgi:ribonucleoside-diphosphate reductase alpha chain